MKNKYLSEFRLNCSWMNAFVVEEFFDFFGDFHVVRQVSAPVMHFRFISFFCNSFRFLALLLFYYHYLSLSMKFLEEQWKFLQFSK